MKILIYNETFINELDYVLESLEQGFDGHDVSFTKNPEEWCDVAVVAGGLKYGLDGGGHISGSKSRMRKPIIDNQRRILFMETMVFRENINENRPAHQRYSFNGFMADDGDFNNKDCPPDRWTKIKIDQKIKVNPWNDTGDHILITLQKENDASLRGLNVNKWAQQTVDTLKKVTKRTIVIRPHPRNPRKYEHIPDVYWSTNPDIHQDLLDCFAVVTYSSLSGIEAITKGIPVFPGSPANFAWDMGNHNLHNIETPEYNDREQWLSNLAYTSWTPEEVAKGIMWEHLTNER